MQVKQEEVGAIYLFCVKRYKDFLALVSCGWAGLCPQISLLLLLPQQVTLPIKQAISWEWRGQGQLHLPLL